MIQSVIITYTYSFANNTKFNDMPLYKYSAVITSTPVWSIFVRKFSPWNHMELLGYKATIPLFIIHFISIEAQHGFSNLHSIHNKCQSWHLTPEWPLLYGRNYWYLELCLRWTNTRPTNVNFLMVEIICIFVFRMLHSMNQYQATN